MHWPNLDRLLAEGRGEVRDRRPSRLRVVARPRPRAAPGRADARCSSRRSTAPSTPVELGALDPRGRAAGAAAGPAAQAACGHGPRGGCDGAQTALAPSSASAAAWTRRVAAALAAERAPAGLPPRELRPEDGDARSFRAFTTWPTTTGVRRSSRRRLLRPAADRRQQPDRRPHPGARGRARSRGVDPDLLRSLPQRPSALGRGRLLGRGDRRELRSTWARCGRTRRAIPTAGPSSIGPSRKRSASGRRPETGIAIVTPVIAMSKAEIVRQGIALRRPLRADLVLLPGERPGLRRLRVLRAAAPGLRRGGQEADPVPYRTRPQA